jgi:hypothetical protein
MIPSAGCPSYAPELRTRRRVAPTRNRQQGANPSAVGHAVVIARTRNLRYIIALSTKQSTASSRSRSDSFTITCQSKLLCCNQSETGEVLLREGHDIRDIAAKSSNRCPSSFIAGIAYFSSATLSDIDFVGGRVKNWG